MNQPANAVIQEILNAGRDLSLATLRPDGYPQATTVSYANDGMTIYIAVAQESQKVRNIEKNDKVSLTISLPYADWLHIKGISMAAHAEVVHQETEKSHAAACMTQRFPQFGEWDQTAQADDIAFLKITPQIVSVLDYQKGFGHTELVKVGNDLASA